MKSAKNTFIKVGLLLLALILINGIGHYIYKRFDLTKGNRYTLSNATKQIVQHINAPVIIDVLLEGTFPPEFKRLQSETKQILEEFSVINSNIKFNFVNPIEDPALATETITQLQNLGLTPTQVTIQEDGKVSQELIFPWAIANLNNQSVKISLLKNKLGTTTQERVNNSVQQLEYAFADGFNKLTKTNKKKVAVLKGNGELPDVYMGDFLSTLSDYYSIAPFTLDTVNLNPEKILAELSTFNLILIAKPTKPFSDAQKYILDQYTMQGGKSVWMIDQVAIAIDSLYNKSGSTVALPIDLNLTDMFFKYGVRVNPSLINDLYFTQIVLASGNGNASQYNPVPWFYHPMVISKNNHPINTNIEAVRFQFTNPIDTLNNTVKKTILLQSSALSKIEGTPKQISLNSIYKEPDKETYNNGNNPLAVLLEGTFTSVYKNRVKPFQLSNNKNESNITAMVIISDGDIIKNQIQNGRPLELGYDKWTNNFYGNKEFLLNTINYLLEDTRIIDIRSKKVEVAFLDPQKINTQKKTWQLVNVLLPVVFFALFGITYYYIRKQKFTS